MNYAVGHSIRIFTRSLYDLTLSIRSNSTHVWNWHVALDEGAFTELLADQL